MNVNEKINGSSCCGCGACIAECPQNAIKMIFDSNWQLYPNLNDNCIHCGKCLAVCPQYKDKPLNDYEPFGFAAIANSNISKNSTSGGIFFQLACEIIKNDGYVSGAVFKEDFSVEHIVSNSIADIVKMQGSKYLQSRSEHVLIKIKKILDKGTQVLFSGTPCQVVGLKLFLKNEYENLFCVDLICSGVSSPKLFDYYLSENFDKKEIKAVIFRNKAHLSGTPSSLTIELNNGKTLFSEYFDNTYMNAFLSNLSKRQSCFNCKFAEFPKVGNISLGDFWGIKEAKSEMGIKNGISIVLINDNKGKNMWERIKTSLAQTESHSINTLMSWNRNKPVITHSPRAKELVNRIEKYNSFRMAVNEIQGDKYEVGIFGVTMNPNFGGLLTYYALYEAINKMGFSTILINKPLVAPDAKDITHSTAFFHKYCKVSEALKPQELYKLNEKIETFVLGSDQVWNYTLFECWDDTLYLDFVEENKKKIAYAASFGHDYHSINPDKTGKISMLLKNFDAIGVREKDGENILKDKYNVDASTVLDPVFLIDAKKYRELSEESILRNSIHDEYIGTYIIAPSSFKLRVVKDIQSHLGLQSQNITDGDSKNFERKSNVYIKNQMPILSHCNIHDWLYMLVHSKFVVTDSFHAVCMCIIFNKPFILLQEEWALSRLYNLMRIFNLENRWVKNFDLSKFKLQSDWFEPLTDSIKLVLRQQIEISNDWLYNSLLASKSIKKINQYKPLLDNKRVEDYFFFLMRNIKDFIVIVSSCKCSRKTIQSIDFKSKLNYVNQDIKDEKCFIMLFDYIENKLVLHNSDYNECKYQSGNKEIIILVNSHNYKINNIYVSGNPRILTELNCESPCVISLYSKTRGEIVDTFCVELSNNVAVIKR